MVHTHLLSFKKLDSWNKSSEEEYSEKNGVVYIQSLASKIQLAPTLCDLINVRNGWKMMKVIVACSRTVDFMYVETSLKRPKSAAHVQDKFYMGRPLLKNYGFSD